MLFVAIFKCILNNTLNGNPFKPMNVFLEWVCAGHNARLITQYVGASNRTTRNGSGG